MASLASQRKERRLFSTSDDNAMMKQVQGTHAPDGREVDVNPILHIVHEILIRSLASFLDPDLHVGIPSFPFLFF